MRAQSVGRFVDGLVEMTGSELDELLRETELERRAAETKLAMIAAVVEQKQQFLVDGHRSMNAYLKAQLNCSGATANRIRRRGKLLNEHPAAGPAIAAGRVSVDNLDLLAKATSHPRVAGRVAEFVPVLVDHAEQFPVRDFSVLVDRVIANADADGAELDRSDDGDAMVAAGADGVYIQAHGGSGLQAAEMKKVFDLAVEAEFAHDVDARRAEHGDQADQHPLPRTAKQRRFAAVHSIFMAWATVPADGQRPEPLVDILFSAGRAQHELAAHGLIGSDGFESSVAEDLLTARCETSTGVPVSRHDALRATVTGHVRRVVIDSASVVIDLGTRRRLFTGAAREAAQLIALSCAHPGCDIPAEVSDVDHVQRHADGGHTDQDNATPACGSHNRYKEHAGLRGRRATNGRTYLVRPDDTVIQPVGQRTPTWTDPDPPPATDPPSATQVVPTLLTETVSWSNYVNNTYTLANPNAWPIIRLDGTDLPRRR